MIRGALIAAALTLAVPPGAASAQTGGENWRQIHTQEDVVFSIDLNSIRTVDGLRHFRIRATNGTTTGYFDNAADCAAKTVDTLYAEMSGKDGSMRKQVFKPGETRNRLDDDEGKLVYAIVCAN